MTTPTIDTRLLLAHRDWLRRLAFQLIQDPAAADDLVQETWMTAIRRRRPPAAPTRPWLAGVLRNKALSRMRAERRRVRRESEAARTEAQDMEPGRALEAVEVGQQLTERVLALSPPLRDAIVLRYYHDHLPSSIAIELGVTESTVRTRLARALERLRDDLDADCGGRERWCSALSAFALANKTARTASALGPVTWLAAGLLAASVAVILTLDVWGGPDPLQALPQSDALLVAAPAPDLAAPADTAGERQAAVESLPIKIKKDPLDAEEVEDGAAIDVTVVGPSGKPMPGVSVRTSYMLGNGLLNGLVTPRAFSLSSGPTTDGRGKARILDVPTGLVRVAGYAADWAIGMSAQAHLTATRPSAELRIVMTRGGSVEGELLDVRGKPAAEIRLYIHLKAWPKQVGRGTKYLQTTHTEADGSFRFDLLPPGVYTLRTRAEGEDKKRVLEQRVEVEVFEGQTTRVVFDDVRGSYVELSGLVLRDGEPLAGASVYASLANRRDSPRRKAETDAEGRFEVTLDEGGDYRFQISERPFRGSVFQPATVPPNPAHELVIAFSTGQISGRVLAHGGQPVAGIEVVASGRSDQEAMGSALRRATTNAAGEYVFQSLLATTYKLGAGRDSSPPRVQDPPGDGPTQDLHLGSGQISGLRLEPGESLSGVDLQLSAAAAIGGFVSDEEGNPLDSAVVKAVRTEQRTRHNANRGETDKAGHFLISGVAPGDYRVRAIWERDVSPWVRLSVDASETASAHLVPQPGTMVTVEVQDGGRPAERCFVRIADAEGFYVESSIAKNGTTTLGPLLPGIYRVVATRDGSYEQKYEQEFSTAGEAAQIVRLTLW